jgi:hypothetical protein
MIRNGVAVFLGCLYVAGSAWLVRGAGEAYRESLRRERPSISRGESNAPRRPEKQSEPVPLAATVEPSASRPEPRPAKAADAAVGNSPPATSSTGQEPPTALPATELARAKPVTPPAVDRAQGAAPNPAIPATRASAAVAFWNQPPLKKAWNLAQLGPGDEAQLGAELHELILYLNQRSETGSWQQRLREAAEPFLKSCERKDIRYTFTVLESDAVNAFSHPGGYIYLCRGLFNLIGEDEDYALQFAIGHEIAHVDRQHAVTCLRSRSVMNLPEGTLQKLYWMIIPFAYLDEQEFEADRWAYVRMRQAGRTDHESLAFLRKLEGYARANGFVDGRVKPKPNGESSPLENHYRAHTATWDRLKHLKEFIATASSPKR